MDKHIAACKITYYLTIVCGSQEDLDNALNYVKKNYKQALQADIKQPLLNCYNVQLVKL